MKDLRKTFSVIIPTYNRHQELDRCLTGLVKQDFPSNKYEVIVVNDGGSSLPNWIGAELKELTNLKIISQVNQGPAAARNAGALIADGDYLAFTDDDCVPAQNWLSALNCHFNQDNNCALGGCILNGLPNNVYTTASQTLIDYLYTYYHLVPGNKAQPKFFSSNNLAITHHTFKELGGFNGRLKTAEDRDLCARLLEAGNTLRYALNAVVFHFHDLTMSTYLMQQFRYGRGNFNFHDMRSQRGVDTYRLEPFIFYTGMLRFPFANLRKSEARKVSLLLLLSQISNVSGFFFQSIVQLFQR